MALAILPDIGNIEAFGQVHIDLQRAALPVAPNRVAQYELELGAVKRALAGKQFVFSSHAVERIDQRAFELVPDFIRTDSVIGPVGEFDDDVVESEILVDIEDQFDDVDTFLLHLFLGAVNMRIVLGEVSHPQ